MRPPPLRAKREFIYIYINIFIYILLCYVSFVLVCLHCPLSGPVLIYISLLIISCIIEYVTNKSTLNTHQFTQQIRILHKTNKKNIFSELLSFWKVCSFTVYVHNIW